ncbi:MAG: ABC transporter ATP-binding protein [Planctomycetaceae bacterium]|nr:MAG: ABC transporter ATP-binding protein [Planctomycetaceae bacterium]
MSSEPSDASLVLSAHHLSKDYGSQQAVIDLSFELRQGEIIGLLGPNGAGKTTAIRVLSTILPATSGHFTILGIPDSSPEKIRAVIGVVPESNGFPRSMTGEEWLIYMGRLYGHSTAQARKKASELLHIVGLESAGRARIFTYSLGMRRRLSIARALINAPRILFLDEPTLGIDPVGHREILQVIRDAAEINKVAVIFSSHLLGDVENICSRALVLKRGRVIAEGTVSNIKQRVSVAQTYRIQVAPEAIPAVHSLLSAREDVELVPRSNHEGEIVISNKDSAGNVDVNEILHQLMQQGIVIEAFSRDSMSLSDAFLAMVEEAKV